MDVIDSPAHFDGKRILVHEAYKSEPNAKHVVSLIQIDDEIDDESMP